MAVVIPDDLVQIDHWWLGVPQNAASPNAGKLFLAYTLTREGQEALFVNQGEDLHYLPGSRTAQQIDQVRQRTGRDPTDLTAQFALENKARFDVVEEVAKAFQR